MDSPTPTETLTLLDRLDALTRELIPLQSQYRDWAREYQRTRIPHDEAEFSQLADRIAGLRQQIAYVHAALRAIGGA